MTDKRVEAAYEALMATQRDRYVCFVTQENMRAILAAADAAFDDRWYSDDDNAYESPADVMDCAPLGAIAEISENVTLSTESWQLVPVTDKGELCPCGKPEGCGDFLSMECRAERQEARRWLSLPKEWQL